MKISNPQSGYFQNFGYVRTVLGLNPVPVSWISVDVGNGSQAFRFVATHLLGPVLDGSPDPLLPLQAGELLTGPAAGSLPTLIAGDFNSTPGDPAYAVMAGGGFSDEWAAANPNDPGLTGFQVVPYINNPTFQPEPTGGPAVGPRAVHPT